ncbi:DUF3891 family protein [Dyadobacter flavalbus]|uniref:DUF3891 family protein n=1 Tax=Dyadobacter flavalbus TaxID=2579942 RepID=A0A5M8QL39_9BACT|nr:DUF3891 family protein [Dyadobacter flavalbus]KAA6436907.1 DUF3891 family protein [Dyadobacter flavalbus]
MIVNYQEKGWQIISQRAHGLLAGQFCYHWKNDMRPERWLETIIATTEHDDAFNEFVNDDNLINENGGPINFKMRVFEEAKCDELLQLALSKSRYIALLTSRHIQFLYQNSEQKNARAFCKMLEKWDRKWLKETGIKKEEITRAYAILEWCDALSLLICQQQIQPENRKIEISGGPDNLQYQLWSKNESELTIEPWPFITDSFRITYESKLVSKLTFKDVKEFREDLKDAPLTVHTFQISRL